MSEVLSYLNSINLSVDEVGAKERAAMLASRSIKTESKMQALKLAVSMIDEGADEIDMVISRGEFLEGNYDFVFDEIRQIKECCVVNSEALSQKTGKKTDVHLKVILETGELETYDNVRRASFIAMMAGADFIKTSTGKVQPAATLPVTLVMLEAIRDFYDDTGKIIGMKPAGGIKTAKDAIAYLVLVNETLGEKWLTPDLLRLGASSVLNDILMQIEKQKSGYYQSADYFTND
jgi:deoxyribose-phosphate aldolase